MEQQHLLLCQLGGAGKNLDRGGGGQGGCHIFSRPIRLYKYARLVSHLANQLGCTDMPGLSVTWSKT